MRVCDTTGLPVCLEAERFIKLNAVAAVVSLLIGALAGITIALTRWEVLRFVSDLTYYRVLTLHGLNMLIFWIIFMEIAILYFAGTTLLKSRLASPAMAWLGFGLMAFGAIAVNVTVLRGRGDVLMTSYPPLTADPMFYGGIVSFAVGTLVAVINFFFTIYIARRDKTYKGSVPLVVFGAITAAIIAVLTLLHGAAIMVPTFLASLGIGWGSVSDIDPAVYRLVWWGLGHPSQQINVAAHVAVWYLLGTLTTGARPLSESVCRTAFVLYILFINLASAHHLLVDPGVSAEWKMWNTSYALYLAVLASMIHGFTVPASIELAMRKKGYNEGLFGWLKAAPWGDPGFAALILSLFIFGFGGGVTGVTLGTHQINIIAHNTLRIPGHFHMTVAGGTTLAFMGLAYYVVPLIFRREYPFKKLCRWQPYVFGLGISLMAIGMVASGMHGAPRRTPLSGVEGAGPWLALLGIGGLVTFTGVMMFVLTTVIAVFFGKSNKGQAIEGWQDMEKMKANLALITSDWQPGKSGLKAKGTVALVLMFLAWFAVYYFANWKALADVWHVR
ncbi:cytochrome C oxidase subunit I [bacterium]|nr:MAG: cytochrome C oxidase subunit I [bacterium]MCQ3951050.1 cytochrome c oxidase subunit I [Planctomycetota bacterium]RIK60811.1 MAG: cytochrome C oxidase subunit I [Planctomycetota bacterium]